jgi:hypothetical protein
MEGECHRLEQELAKQRYCKCPCLMRHNHETQHEETAYHTVGQRAEPQGKRLSKMGKRKRPMIAGTNSPAPPARRRHFYRGEDGDISNALRHPQGIKLESSELRT